VEVGYKDRQKQSGSISTNYEYVLCSLFVVKTE